MATTFTNLITNPRPGATDTGWSHSAGTGGVVGVTALTSSGGPAGGNARRITWSTAPTNLGGNQFFGNTTVPVPITAGALYSGSIYVRTTRSQVMIARLSFTDAAYAILGQSDGNPTAIPANTWTEVKVENATATALAANARLTAAIGTGGNIWQVGDNLDCQAATIVAGASVPQPFHGGMTDDASHDYSWVGTADASRSTLVLADVLLPPSGLTSTVLSTTSLRLDWFGAAGAAAYDVERNGFIVASGVGGTSYTDTGIPDGSSPVHRVRSVGA